MAIHNNFKALLNNIVILLFLTMLSLTQMLLPAISADAASTECRDIEEAYFNAAKGTLPSNTALLMGCLMDKVKKTEIQSNGTIAMNSPEAKSSDGSAFRDKDIMLKYAGALRNILGDGTNRELIAQFRAEVDTDVAAVLAAGARSDDKTVRIYSSLILSTTIDNTTACVVIDNLLDENLGNSEYGVNGRANLLGVLRSIARWAFKENVDAIQTVIDHTRKELGDQTIGFEKTIGILADLEERISPNKRLSDGARDFADTPLPSSLRKSCAEYVPRFAQDGQMNYGT